MKDRTTHHLHLVSDATGDTIQSVARACLAQHGVTADVHITLSSYGLRKRYREDCSEDEADALFEDMKRIIASDRMQPQPQPSTTGTSVPLSLVR